VEAPRIAWVGEDDVAAALAAAVGAPRMAASDWRAMRRRRIEVLHVRGDLPTLRAAALGATLGGVLAVVATPTFAPCPLPWWERRFHRYLFDTQDTARAWRASGLALGRLVVVERGDVGHEAAALRAVYAEVASMGRRPGWVTRAPP
jgi:hypothetical protein